MKTFLIKTMIDFFMTIAIIGTVFEESIKDSIVYILVAIAVATMNAIFEYAVLPLMKKCRKYLKSKMPDKFDKIVDDIFDKVEDEVEDFKDDVIDNLKQRTKQKEKADDE